MDIRKVKKLIELLEASDIAAYLLGDEAKPLSKSASANNKLIEKGREIFSKHCADCHTAGEVKSLSKSVPFNALKSIIVAVSAGIPLITSITAIDPSGSTE